MDLNGSCENGAVSVAEAHDGAEAAEQSTGPEADPGAEAKLELEAKGDEAAEFWAALQGKQPEQNGTAVVSPSHILEAVFVLAGCPSPIAHLLKVLTMAMMLSPK